MSANHPRRSEALAETVSAFGKQPIVAERLYWAQGRLSAYARSWPGGDGQVWAIKMAKRTLARRNVVEAPGPRPKIARIGLTHSSRSSAAGSLPPTSPRRVVTPKDRGTTIPKDVFAYMRTQTIAEKMEILRALLSRCDAEDLQSRLARS